MDIKKLIRILLCCVPGAILWYLMSIYFEPPKKGCEMQMVVAISNYENGIATVMTNKSSRLHDVINPTNLIVGSRICISNND